MLRWKNPQWLSGQIPSMSCEKLTPCTGSAGLSQWSRLGFSLTVTQIAQETFPKHADLRFIHSVLTPTPLAVPPQRDSLNQVWIDRSPCPVGGSLLWVMVQKQTGPSLCLGRPFVLAEEAQKTHECTWAPPLRDLSRSSLLHRTFFKLTHAVNN